MRNYLLAGWLLLPIGAWAYHEGPGQDRVALEEVDAALVTAHASAAAGAWQAAITEYEAALAALPKDAEDTCPGVRQRLQVELNKARLEGHELPIARDELGALVLELDGDTQADPQVRRDARQALAQAQFYTTWLMRLEGLDRSAWEPEIEAARQNWRLLAEQATTTDEVAHHQRDLEAAVRLSRLEIEDLQGLPLPSQ